jgi:myosin heavy subunit
MGEIARQMAFMRGENDEQVVGNGFDDMTQIDNLSESTILLNLNVRYMQDKIYVCPGKERHW